MRDGMIVLVAVIALGVAYLLGLIHGSFNGKY
jgi:hypothetical protein